MRICKSFNCKRNVASGKGTAYRAARLMGYCWRCYKEHFRPRKPSNLPGARMGAERLLDWTERRASEHSGFNPEVWSPAFRREMEDYWKARMKGEVS